MNNLTISTKIFAGMGTILVVLAGIAVFATEATFSMGGLFNDYRNSARQTLMIADMKGQLSSARLGAFKYRTNQSAEAIEQAREGIAKIHQLDKAAIEEFWYDTEFVEKVNKLDELASQYEAEFSSAIEKQKAKDKETDALSKIGPEARKALTEVISSAAEANDIEAAYVTGKVQQELLLGRYYMERFIQTQSQAAFDRSIGHLAEASVVIEELLSAIQNPDWREKVMLARDNIALYSSTGSALQDIILDRDQHYAVLDKVGPQMATIILDIIGVAQTRQNTLGPEGIEKGKSTTFWVPAIAGVALLLGALLAFFVSRGISRSIGASVNQMTELADGHLDIRIDGAERTNELGRMAAALVTFRDRAIEAKQLTAEKAESDARALAKEEEERVKEAERLKREHEQARESEKREAEKERVLAAEKAEADKAIAEEREKMAAIEREQLAKLERVKSSIEVTIEAAIAGDLSQRVDDNVDDESLRDMARAINSLLEITDECLGRASHVLSALAAGDMRPRLQGEYTGVFDNLKSTMNSSIETLSNLIVDVRRNGDSVTSGSGEIRSAADEMARRTESNAATIEETTAALTAFTQSVSTVAKSVDRVASEAVRAKDQAVSSGEVATSALRSIEEIAAGSDEISNIVSVIEDISFQINLLSLNAGVEAARAGEAGRGFTVVATEVRALAQRTNDAVGEIANVISTSKASVDKGVAQVKESTTVLEGIVKSVVDISSQMANISDEVSEQDRGIGEITTAMHDFDSTIQRNAAMCQELNAGSDTLAADADQLSQLLSRFQITDGAIYSEVEEPHRMVANG